MPKGLLDTSARGRSARPDGISLVARKPQRPEVCSLVSTTMNSAGAMLSPLGVSMLASAVSEIMDDDLGLLEPGSAALPSSDDDRRRDDPLAAASTLAGSGRRHDVEHQRLLRQIAVPRRLVWTATRILASGVRLPRTVATRPPPRLDVETRADDALFRRHELHVPHRNGRRHRGQRQLVAMHGAGVGAAGRRVRVRRARPVARLADGRFRHDRRQRDRLFRIARRGTDRGRVGLGLQLFLRRSRPFAAAAARLRCRFGWQR